MVSLKSDDVDAFVFWSKNPGPFLKRLHLLENHSFYFQFTLNNYPDFLEPGLPAFDKRVHTFKNLVGLTSKDRVVLRYDPIILTNNMDISFHLENIHRTLELLSGYTEKLMISFMTPYKKVQRKLAKLESQNNFLFKTPELDEIKVFSVKLGKICKLYKIKVYSCANNMFEKSSIEKGSCIDKDLINSIKGSDINFKYDSGQRDGCGCVKSIDMGVYNTCSFHCSYCYANHSKSSVLKNLKKYNISNNSLLL